MKQHYGLVQVCAAGVLWGTGGVVVSLLNERDAIGPMTASAWRMLLAAVGLLAVVLVSRRARDLQALVRERPVLTIATGVGTAAYQGLYFVSVLEVGVAVATVVSLGLAPLVAATWEHLRRRSRPRPTEFAVLAAALLGLILISSHDDAAAPGSATLGLVLAALAGVLYAATTLLGRRLAAPTSVHAGIDPITLTTAATSAGAVALLPFLAVAIGTDRPVMPGSTGSWLLLLYLGLATMALAYALLYAGLRTVSGSAATVATLLEPVSAALLAAAVLDETLGLASIVGGLLILGAITGLREPVADPPA